MNDQPHSDPGKGGDRVLAALAIFLVLGVAVMEIALLIPGVLHIANNAMDATYLCISCVALVLLWLYCLRAERAHVYERTEAKWYRRRGYTLQMLALVVYGASEIQDRHPAAIIILAVIVLLALGTWRNWLSTLALTPEQQQAIDELIEERDRRVKERIEAEQEKASSLRFEAVRAQYELPGRPQAENSPAPAEPVIDWNIPKGRHTPVVYFLRNGDRIKIGTTTDLRARVRRLSLRMDDLKLVIPGDRAVERKMHQTFRTLRVGNTEWFQYAGVLAEFLAEETSKILADGGDEA